MKKFGKNTNGRKKEKKLQLKKMVKKEKKSGKNLNKYLNGGEKNKKILRGKKLKNLGKIDREIKMVFFFFYKSRKKLK